NGGRGGTCRSLQPFVRSGTLGRRVTTTSGGRGFLCGLRPRARLGCQAPPQPTCAWAVAPTGPRQGGNLRKTRQCLPMLVAVLATGIGATTLAPPGAAHSAAAARV